ncbi:MAG: ceramidase domain-containing protein [Planctomycetota bacterium]
MRPGDRAISPRGHLFAWGGTLLLGVVVAVVAGRFDGRQPWDGWEPSHELDRPGSGERIERERTIRTRANTYSNLAYVLVGLYAGALAIADRRRGRGEIAGMSDIDERPDRTETALTLSFAVAMVWLGLMSGLFHASLTRMGQRLDVSAQYPPLLAIVCLGAARWLPRRIGAVPTWTVLVGAMVVAEGLLYRYKWSMSATTVLATLILAVGLVALVEHMVAPGRHQAGWFVAALVMLVAAVACRQLDVARRFTGPDTIVQGHALWHLLTAAALGAMWLHERSGRGGETVARSLGGGYDRE